MPRRAQQKIEARLSASEMEMLDEAKRLLGIKSTARLIRHLLAEHHARHCPGATDALARHVFNLNSLMILASAQTLTKDIVEALQTVERSARRLVASLNTNSE